MYGKIKIITMIDKKVRVFWKNYIIQSILATLTLFIVLLFLSIQQAVIIASIGATAFIVFAMPKNITANSRNVIGGHLIGLFSGSICSLIPHSSFLFSISMYSLAVGLSIFLMIITDTEHPPASGTALGVALRGFDMKVSIAVVISAVILSAVHNLFGQSLKDLT